MPETPFNVGDTVRLKSGGPIMTVTKTNVGEQSKIETQWFDANHELKSDFFIPETLKRAQGGGDFAAA